MREQYQIKSTQKLHIKFDHKRHFMFHKDQFLIRQYIFIFFIFLQLDYPDPDVAHFFPTFAIFAQFPPTFSPSQRKTLFLLSNLAVASRSKTLMMTMM